MCSTHFARFEKRGTTDPPQYNGMCKLEDCHRKESARSGMCRMHLRRSGQFGFCTFAGCDRPRRNPTAELCEGHYGQEWASLPLTDLKFARSDPGTLGDRDDQDRKCCRGCGEWKSSGAFGKARHYSDGLNMYCKPCTLAQRYAFKYGLTTDQIKTLRAEQGGRCKICRVHEDDLDRPLYVDHDHTHCGKKDRGCPECVRGLLCGKCNSAIGMMNDSPERLIAAAEYLRAARAVATTA